MERSEFNEVVASLHGDAKRRGLFFQHCEDNHFEPNQITLQGQRLTSFGSCSYLGLEHHPRLRRGVIDAVERFGTQFSTSRGYLSCPLYQELEENLSEIFGGYVLCMPTTTLAHLAAFDVLITERDALVLDHHVHASVQKAAHIARGSGARVEFVKHGELERAVEFVKQLSPKHRTVWFSTDGITSMYGSMAPFDILRALLEAAPNVRLYIDDAHGMSWAGKHGRGSFLSRMPLTDRIVLATSLAKAFGTGGGVLAFTNKEEMERVRMCGGTAIFSGPIQPPMLGASLASSRVHLSPEIYERQERLQENISFANQQMIEARLPLLLENEAPISFVGMGLPRIAHEVAARVKEDGIYLNVSTFPTVPMKRAGLRIAINVNHSREDISRMVDSIKENLSQVLSQEGVEREQLEALFDGAVRPQEDQQVLLGVKKSHQAPRLLRRRSAFLEFLDANNNNATSREVKWSRTGVDIDPALLSVQHERSIHKIDKATWDQALAGAGCISWEAMAVTERVFQGQERPEHNWRFHYILVRDPAGELVAATSFTTMLQKDDMLMREKVSQAIEALRKDDPYFLTSRALTMGSGLSEGNHLFLDRAGPWRAGLLRLLEVADQLYEAEQADILALRDLPGDDPEMDAFLLEQGLVKVPNFDSHLLDLTKSEAEIFSGLNRTRRSEMKEIEAQSGSFSTQRHLHNNDLKREEITHLHSLYRNIASQKVRLNTFELPSNLLTELLRSSAWEVVTLHLSAEAGGPSTPVAFWAAHKSQHDYAPLFAGLDYNYVRSHGAYRQMILAITRRARELGAMRLHMGMDAELEKRRFGAEGKKTCLYLQARGDYNAAILQKIVAEVELATKQKSA
jgi:7-keto-8-aminopelargonate synthetase-like enzyme